MHFPKLERRPELDALRGIFLAWMIFVHLPTRFSDLAAQPFGFVSAAEGFVLLSALLVARIYSREHSVDAGGVRRHLWRRSLKIYGYHLALIAFTFTVVAAYAVHVHRLALMNLLDFYLAHPVAGAVGALARELHGDADQLIDQPGSDHYHRHQRQLLVRDHPQRHLHHYSLNHRSALHCSIRPLSSGLSSSNNSVTRELHRAGGLHGLRDGELQPGRRPGRPTCR